MIQKDLKEYQEQLYREEKSAITIEKYIRDARAFLNFLEGREPTKELVLSYKGKLIEAGYKIGSINSMLASVNSFLNFIDAKECKVKSLKQQKEIYMPTEKELTKKEYFRLLEVAKKSGQIQLYMIMQTICGTGIRISELSYFTIEAVRHGEVYVSCKNKNRIVLIPGKLKKKLLRYAKRERIKEGSIFVTKTGKPLNRSNIWSRMKKLCGVAKVNPQKVFPHNLRKLFARTFYNIEKDIAKLADILGHGSVETTRIYVMTTGAEHLRKVERLGLVV